MTATATTAPAAPVAVRGSAAAHGRSGARRYGALANLVIVAGVLFAISGASTWALVQTSLADERITVAEDASWLAGDKVDGPFSAYAETVIIEKHSLTASAGMTYSELDRKDPTRATVMNGSFLRASLFTSIVTFGVAAFAMVLGVVLVMVGMVLRHLVRTPRTA